MKKIIMLFLCCCTTFLFGCTNDDDYNYNGGFSNVVSASSYYIDDIKITSVRNSGNTIYMSHRLYLIRSVSSYSNLKVSINASCRFEVLFKDGTTSRTTLSSYFSFTNSLNASSQCYINSSRSVYDVLGVSINYQVTSVKGTLYLE